MIRTRRPHCFDFRRSFLTLFLGVCSAGASNSEVSRYLLAEVVPTAHAQEQSSVMLDAVVASVDGRPITLSEVTARLPAPRQVTLSQAAADTEIQRILDELIFERLLEIEAEARRITVSEDEVNGYMEEVAKRNGLGLAEFRSALVAQGRDVTEYQRQVKFEILRSRLSNSVSQSGVGITQKEVEQYLEEHPEFSSKGDKVKLSRIVLNNANKSPEELKAKLDALNERLTAQVPFSQLVREFSESADSTEGGSLGVVPERQLSSEIFDAIFGLKTGEVSKPVSTANATYVFKVEERYSTEGDTKALENEIRRILRAQKLNTSVMTFFTAELYKLHAVDKKI